MSEQSLRERKKARTRESLIRVAHQLFQQQGFEATTVEQIVDAAEVSRRTFFRYFPAKEAVVFPYNEQRLARLSEALDRGPEGLAGVRAALLELARDFVRERATMLAQQRLIKASPALAALERQHDDQWEAALARALGRGGNKGQKRRARWMAGAMMGMTRAILSDWYATEARTDLVRLANQGFDLLETGIKVS